MEIAILNQSTMVKDADVKVMVSAIQIQLIEHVLPAWNMKSATINFYADEKSVPSNAWVIYIIDDNKQVSGALGWHEEVSDQVVGYIVCEPILSNGGVVMAFDPKNPGQYTVSGTLSHEILEALLDPFTSSYYDCGTTTWCAELCDPVEQIGYGIKVGDVEVAVSDFVCPQFFNQEATFKDAPFNYLNTLRHPFTILDGGYAIVRTGGSIGKEKQIFGKLMPQWRRDTKTKVISRSQQRVKMAKKNHPSVWVRVWSWMCKLAS